MANLIPNVRLCDNGKGWCIEAFYETYGPLESEDEANLYASLLNRVNAARTQFACTEDACWQ